MSIWINFFGIWELFFWLCAFGRIFKLCPLKFCMWFISNWIRRMYGNYWMKLDSKIVKFHWKIQDTRTCRRKFQLDWKTPNFPLKSIKLSLWRAVVLSFIAPFIFPKYQKAYNPNKKEFPHQYQKRSKLKLNCVNENRLRYFRMHKIPITHSILKYLCVEFVFLF